MPLLECRDLTMNFGGTAALRGASITAESGVITGLIGPNGAGKTTLFDCIGGLLQPTSGEVLFDDQPINRLPPYKRSRLGIARTFQRRELFVSLSVRDNIRVAGDIASRWQRAKTDTARETDRVLELLGMSELADREVTEIPTGMARRVEVGRALMTRPKMLLLDEPASGQNETETAEFGELLLHLRDTGMAILLVEHDVSLVMRVCSHIHVLDFGAVIASGSPAAIQQDQRVLSAYLGEIDSAVTAP
jgi:branched-chain amino acid transport system ATP-binding protein